MDRFRYLGLTLQGVGAADNFNQLFGDGCLFPAAWLRLDKLGKMPPSGGDYQFYKNLKVEPMLIRAG